MAILFTGPPGPPSKPTPKAMGDVEVTLVWNPPEEDGGSPVVAYNLEFCLDGEKTWKPVKNDLVECEFTAELELDKVYRFRVTAKNEIGLGKPSPISDPISLSECDQHIRPQMQFTDLLLPMYFLIWLAG